MNNKEKIIGIILAAILLAIVPMNSFADDGQLNMAGKGGTITPYWAGVSIVSYNLICSSGKANPLISVEVDPGKVDKVNFKGSLRQYKNNKWVAIESWNMDKQVSLGRCSFDESYRISSGYDYKFITTIKAYKGSTLVDTIDIESEVEEY